MERNKIIVLSFLALVLLQDTEASIGQCTNNRTIQSVLKAVFEEVVLEVS